MLKSILTQRRINIITKLRYLNSQQKVKQPPNSEQQLAQESKQQVIKNNGKVLGNILIHVQSEAFRKNFNIQKYVHKHSFSLMHLWMLDYRTRIFNSSWSQLPFSIFYRLYMKILVNYHTTREVRSYSDRTQPNVYYELKRIQNVIYWSLDDYFVYNFKQKSLKQIFCQDFGLYVQKAESLSEEQQQNLVKIQKYLQNKMKQLNETPIRIIMSENFKWSL